MTTLPQGLAGVRVVEMAEMAAGPWATKLLADLGADVIKVEPPGGDRSRRVGPFPPGDRGDSERSGLFLGLNTNKRSLVLDLDAVEDRARLAELVGEADIVVHDLGPTRAGAAGLDGAELLERHPDLVVCAITPYGQTGPHAEWLGEELNIVHGGGWGYLIPGDDPDPTAPPLTVPGWPASYQAGMAAALASLAAHHRALATGIGEFIDMSAMAQVSAMLEASFIAWSYMGEIPGRSDGRILTPWHIFRCADGLMFLVTVEQDQWERLVDMMGSPDWATGGLFDTIEDRALNQDVLNMFLEEWTLSHTVDELWHEGQKRRICFAPVFSAGDLEGQPHLAERGYFHHVDHSVAGGLTYLGAPSKMIPDPWAVRTAAPRLGEGGEAGFTDPRRARPVGTEPAAVAQRPLEGVRVVDFSWVWAGPFATMHLAYLGADVIKIESSARPSLARRLPIHPPELEPTLNTCGYFNQWDQGKRSVEIDLTDATGVEAALKLVADADVVVDNYATGVMDRLGLGDDVLRAANPDLIIASITGYGRTGPLREYMGYGPTTCPLSGLTALTGHPGGPPTEAGLSIGDPASGLATAYAIMAALFARGRGGAPTRIDTSLWEATGVMSVHAFMAHQLGDPMLGPDGSRFFADAPHGVFRAQGDDEWLSVACTDDAHWRSLAPLIGVDADAFPTAVARKTAEAELEAAVAAWAARHDKWQAAELLQAAGVPAYPSVSCAELEGSVQHDARGFWARFDHPEVGRRTHSGVPWLTLNGPGGVTGRAPLLGEHTSELLD